MSRERQVGRSFPVGCEGSIELEPLFDRELSQNGCGTSRRRTLFTPRRLSREIRFIPDFGRGALQIPSLMGEDDGLVERDEYERQRLREDEGVSRCYETFALTCPDRTPP